MQRRRCSTGFPFAEGKTEAGPEGPASALNRWQGRPLTRSAVGVQCRLRQAPPPYSGCWIPNEERMNQYQSGVVEFDEEDEDRNRRCGTRGRRSRATA